MKKTKSFYVSLVFSLLIMVNPVVYSLYHLIRGHKESVCEIILCASLVAFALSMIFVCAKKLRGAAKVVITFIILCVASVACFGIEIIGYYVVFESYNGIEEIKTYNEVFEEDYRPEDYYKDKLDISKYGDFEEISHYYYLHESLLGSAANTTIVKYNDEAFEFEKKKIEAENKFSEETETNSVGVITYEGFDFRLVEENKDEYYDELIYIGINEDTNEILYACSRLAARRDVDDLKFTLEVGFGWDYIIEERTKK